MSTDPMVKSLGLINRPNQYGVIPAGSMFDCQQVFLRKAGSLEPAPVLTQWTTTTAQVGTLELIATSDVTGTTDQRMLSVISPTGAPPYAMRWYSNTGVATASESYSDIVSRSGAVPISLIANRPFLLRHRDRFFVLTNQAVVVHDLLRPSTLAERAPRLAGWARGAPYPQVFFTASTGGPFGANELAAYKVILRRVYADGYAITSAPTSGIVAVNTLGAGAIGNVEVTMPTPFFAGADTFVEIYRTYIRPNATDPGATYYLCRSIRVTAANAGTVVSVTDSLPNVGLGEALYTNPGGGGELQSNLAPPFAKTAAVYKGFAFYANLVQPPRAKILAPIPSTLSLLPAGDVRRLTNLGSRQGTGTSAIGSSQLTAVSAADIAGVAVGQQITHAGWPASVRVVTAVGATTITLSGATATVAGASTFSALDVLYYRQAAGSGYSSVPVGGQVSVLLSLLVLQATANHATATPLSGLSYDWIEFTLSPNSFQDGSILELIASNGQNYTPQLPSPTGGEPTSGQSGLVFNQTIQPNGFQWSKDQQPEACPVVNIGFCGSGDILKIESTRDALYFFCTDGIFRLSGSGGQWRLDPLNSTLVITGPKCTGVLGDNVYAYTNVGLVRISSDQLPQRLSESRLNEMQGSPYAEDQATMLLCDESNNEVWVSFAPSVAGSGGRWRVYNADTDTFVSNDFATTGVTAATYSSLGNLPAGQEGSLEFGGPDVSVAGHIIRHMKTAPTAWLAPVCNYQPFFGKRVETTKQWIRATHFFSNGMINQVQARWNQIAAAGLVVPVGQALNADSRATFWVPRNAAISPTLVIGWSMPLVTAAYEYLGFSVEFEELTTQQRAR